MRFVARRVETPGKCVAGADDQGSLAAVMAIFFVVILLSVALVDRVLGDNDNVNLETRTEQARSLAQSGVADALFQIDQQGASPSSICNDASYSSKCLTGIPGAPGVIYNAIFHSATDTYTVSSQGTVRNATYAVQATVTRIPLLDNAVYGGSFVTFDGKSDTSVTVTDEYGNPVAGGTAGIAVGPGGTLTCNGPTDPNAVYVNYGGTINKCAPAENLGPVYAPQQPTQGCPAPPNSYGAPPTPCVVLSSAGACSSVSPGHVTGSDSAGYTIAGTANLEPGIHICRGGLTLTGTLNVDYAQSPTQNNGRVQIFVFPPVGETSPSPNISTSGATINACETTGTGSGTCKGGLVGDPTDLEIYAWGSGTASIGASNVNAILWAPAMNVTLNGSANSLTWTGSLILGSVTADGHPSFNLNFDQRLQTEYDQVGWQITNYVQTTPNFAMPGF